jgi:hypothetical protein
MKESKKAILDGVLADSSKIIAPNTVEYFKDGSRFIRFHHTDILIFLNNCLRLSTGGWKTVTTKDRITRFLPSNYRLYSENGLWIISSPAGQFPFQDGMVFDLKTHKAQDVPSLDITKKNTERSRKKSPLISPRMQKSFFPARWKRLLPGIVFTVSFLMNRQKKTLIIFYLISRNRILCRL